MFSYYRKILFALFELLLCIGAIVFKKLLDTVTQRNVLYNQKFSMEWRHLSLITDSDVKKEFSTLVYVGYSFFTAVLLIFRILDRKEKAASYLLEKLILCFGVFFYTFEGIILLISLEMLPSLLHSYAYILGNLSIIVALMFTLDVILLGLNRQMADKSVGTECSLNNQCDEKLRNIHTTFFQKKFRMTDL